MPKYIAVAYTDFLACLFALFAAFYLLSSDDTSKGNLKDISQFIAEVTWNKDSGSDIDLWLKGPDGAITNFQHKKNGPISLDQDDLAVTPVDVMRREAISVRAIVPGHYVVSVMLYRISAKDNEGVPVTARVMKLQPFDIVIEKAIALKFSGEEQTIVSFDVDSDGKVFNVDDLGQVTLVGG